MSVYHDITLYVIEILLKKRKKQQPPSSLFLVYEQLLANTVVSVIYYMYSIAMAIDCLISPHGLDAFLQVTLKLIDLY